MQVHGAQHYSGVCLTENMYIVTKCFHIHYGTKFIICDWPFYTNKREHGQLSIYHRYCDTKHTTQVIVPFKKFLSHIYSLFSARQAPSFLTFS